MITVEYNDVASESIPGLFVTKFPVVTLGEKRVTEFTLAGRDGNVYVDDGVYNPTIIKCEFGCLGTVDDLQTIVDKCLEWLESEGNMRLRISNRPGHFYVVSKSSITDITQEMLQYTLITAEFTCHPFKYVDGSYNFQEISNDGIYNIYSVSHPLYRIHGEGRCVLNVNGKEFIAQVGQNLIIDTGLKLSYREDGTLNNIGVTGDYEDLYICRGYNEIAITSGFTLQIAPMWRVRG